MGPDKASEVGVAVPTPNPEGATGSMGSASILRQELALFLVMGM